MAPTTKRLATFRDWSDLPSGPISEITKHLRSIDDYTSVRGVCKSWRVSAILKQFDRSVPKIPCLVYQENASEVKLFDILRNTSFPLRNYFKSGGKYYSSYGWLLRVGKNLVADLIHPRSTDEIKLPNLDTFPHGIANLKRTRAQKKKIVSKLLEGCSVRKMVLSGSPLSDHGADLLIIVIWGAQNKLGYSRPGDDSWTRLDSGEDQFVDIVYHNGKVYAMKFINDIVTVVEYDIIHCGHNQTRRSFSFPEIEIRNLKDKFYLVEDSLMGKLLIVYQFFVDCGTLTFQLFEMDVVGGRVKEIFNLGKERTMFLGYSSFLCHDISVYDGKVMRNSIYTSEKIIYCLYARKSLPLSGSSYKLSVEDGSSYNLTGLDWVLPTF